MIELKQHPAGIIVPIHARARAGKNAIVGEYAGRLKITVTPAPRKGKANDAILKLLASSFNLKHSQVSLIAGARPQQKQVLVEDADVDELRQQIDVGLRSVAPIKAS